MTDSTDEFPPELAYLQHYGVRGMRWGVQTASKGRDAALRATKEHRSTSRQFKTNSKLNSGEVVVSAMLGGPIGVLGYKMVKRGAAKTKMQNRDLSPEEQTAAAAKIGLGKALVVGALTTPLGLVTYAAAKSAAARQVETFK